MSDLNPLESLVRSAEDGESLRDTTERLLRQGADSEDMELAEFAKTDVGAWLYQLYRHRLADEPTDFAVELIRLQRESEKLDAPTASAAVMKAAEAINPNDPLDALPDVREAYPELWANYARESRMM